MVHLAGEGDKHKCPNCGSKEVDIVDEDMLICMDCGYSGSST